MCAISVDGTEVALAVDIALAPESCEIAMLAPSDAKLGPWLRTRLRWEQAQLLIMKNAHDHSTPTRSEYLAASR